MRVQNIEAWQAYGMVRDMNTLIMGLVTGEHESEKVRKRKIEELMGGLYFVMVEHGVYTDIPPMSLVIDAELNITEYRVPIERFVEVVNKDLCGWKLMLEETDWYQGWLTMVKL